MDRFLEDAIQGCQLSALYEKTANSRTAPIQAKLWRDRAWQRVAIDVRGPDLSLGIQHKFAIMVIECFSMLIKLEFMKKVAISTIMNFLRNSPEEKAYRSAQSPGSSSVAIWCGIEHMKTPVKFGMQIVQARSC